MHVILGRYGPFFLYSYSVVLSLGILLGMGLTARTARQLQISGWLDAWLFTLGGALIGGRVGFVALHWAFFGERPLTIFQLWQGGFSYHGALLVGLFSLAGYCLLWKRSLWIMLTLFTPAFVLLSAFGWLACWLEGCAYGRATTLGLLAADLPDELGVFAVRYQTQLLGIIGSSLIFTLTIRLWQKQSRYLVWTAFFLLALLRISIGFLRGDAAFVLFGLRLDVILDGFVAVFALFLLQLMRRTVNSEQ